jgi:hypothetical protein
VKGRINYTCGCHVYGVAGMWPPLTCARHHPAGIILNTELTIGLRYLVDALWYLHNDAIAGKWIGLFCEAGYWLLDPVHFRPEHWTGERGMHDRKRRS